MVKEEIKAFLGNRRISQAVVAQVTGKKTLQTFSDIQHHCQISLVLCVDSFVKI